VPVTERQEAKRLEPREGLGKDGKIIAGAIPSVEGLPPDIDLMDEYDRGKPSGLTMEMMAAKYGVSSSLVHRKISRARLLIRQEVVEEQQQTDLDRELRYTKSAVELFRQVEENCGWDAVGRVFGMVRLQMGMMEPSDWPR
jgi:AraC-like DNA-binding protein